MTALDIFREAKARADEASRIDDRIQRRRDNLTGCTSRPMSGDGGSGSGRDRSMMMLDSIADIDRLAGKSINVKKKLDALIRCCLYLAAMLPDRLGELMLILYVEGETAEMAGDRLGYSTAHIRRLRKEAEELASGIDIVIWDGRHVPIVRFKN